MELLLMTIILQAVSLSQGEPQNLSLSESCSGTLGTLQDGMWVAVTLRPVKKEKIVQQICRDLRCGNVLTYSENKTLPNNTCLTNCTMMNSTLHNCTAQANCSTVTEVVCEHQVVRLAAGRDSCAGRVELLHAGQWGSVCDDDWDIRGGNVVCAQLGCGSALRVTGEAGDFGPGSGPVHISKLNCTGAERNLWNCSAQELHSNYCGHKEDAGVVCSGSAAEAVTFNITEPNLTNWTTESTVTEMIMKKKKNMSSMLSVPVLGCIILSITLVLVLLSNAFFCKHYKRKQAHVIYQNHQGLHTSDEEITGLHMVTAHPDTVQTSVQGLDTLVTRRPEAPKPEARRPSQDDSETSSDSNYEHYYNYGAQQPPNVNDLQASDDAPVVGKCNQAKATTYKEAKMTGCYVLDSESTSSGECYENAPTKTENLFLNQDVSQFYPEHSLQMAPLLTTSQQGSRNSNPSDSDSTSSGECYENTGMEAETFVQTQGSPSLPEQDPPNYHNAEPTGHGNFLQQDTTNQDNSSTSSDDAYENVPEIDEENSQSSSSSEDDYDDVANW